MLTETIGHKLKFKALISPWISMSRQHPVPFSILTKRIPFAGLTFQVKVALLKSWISSDKQSPSMASWPVWNDQLQFLYLDTSIMIYKISFLGQGYNVVLQVDVILQNYVVLLSSPILKIRCDAQHAKSIHGPCDLQRANDAGEASMWSIVVISGSSDRSKLPLSLAIHSPISARKLEVE